MRRTMQRRLLLLLIFAIALSACGRGEKAQQELASQGIEYNETKFIEPRETATPTPSNSFWKPA